MFYGYPFATLNTVSVHQTAQAACYSSAGLSIVEVRTLPELERHAEAWERLVLESTPALPRQSYSWISAFLEHKLFAGKRWCCLLAYDGDRLVGALPLIEVRSYKLPFRPVLLMKVPYDALHTTSVDALTLRGRENLMGDFVRYLQVSRNVWPVIRLRLLPDHSASVTWMKEDRGACVFSKVSGAANYIRLPAQYSTYHDGLSHGFMRQLKRRGRKLEELKAVNFRLRESSRSVEENLASFIEVEDSGWKGKAQSSVGAAAGNAALFLAAARRFESRGWLEWNFLEAEGKTIAAQFAVRIRRTLHVLKIGYREDYSFCTPGNLLFAKVIENSCAQGDVDEINCMTSWNWHKDWNMKSRKLYDLIVFPRIPMLSGFLRGISSRRD